MLDAMGGCRDQEHRNNTDLNTNREAMELSKKKKKKKGIKVIVVKLQCATQKLEKVQWKLLNVLGYSSVSAEIQKGEQKQIE